jgi:hypothetical protein
MRNRGNSPPKASEQIVPATIAHRIFSLESADKKIRPPIWPCRGALTEAMLIRTNNHDLITSRSIRCIFQRREVATTALKQTTLTYLPPLTICQLIESRRTHQVVNNNSTCLRKCQHLPKPEARKAPQHMQHEPSLSTWQHLSIPNVHFLYTKKIGHYIPTRSSANSSDIHEPNPLSKGISRITSASAEVVLFQSLTCSAPMVDLVCCK